MFGGEARFASEESQKTSLCSKTHSIRSKTLSLRHVRLTHQTGKSQHHPRRPHGPTKLPLVVRIQLCVDLPAVCGDVTGVTGGFPIDDVTVGYPVHLAVRVGVVESVAV